MCDLQSLCISSILENFEQFYYAFTVSKDANLQRSFQFLQRRYSNRLAEKLLEDERNTDKYFDFLINEHLTELDFDCFRNSPYLDSIDDIFCRLPKLRRINLCFCGDEVFESISKFCPNIVDILASHSNVSDKGINYLCEMRNEKLPCPGIRNIFLFDTLVTDSGVESLVRCLPLLEKIRYENLPMLLFSMHKKDLPEFLNVPHYNLIELDVRQWPTSLYTEVIETCLAVCPKLKSIYCNIAKQEHFNMFNKSCLETFKCFVPAFSNISLDNFIRISSRNLTCLTIGHCVVSASVLAIHCPALKDLSLIDVQFKDDGNLHSVFPCLEKCFFNGYFIEKAFLLISSSSPNLVSVTFSFFPTFKVIQEQVLTWCMSSTVKIIRFQDIKLKISFLEDLLLKCHSLKLMELPNNFVDVINPIENLKILAQSLPNKPAICYTPCVICDRSNTNFDEDKVPYYYSKRSFCFSHRQGWFVHRKLL